MAKNLLQISAILAALKTAAETDLPDLLYDADLDNFAVYHIGASKDAEQKGFFIYQNPYNFSYERENFEAIIHLQLFKCEEQTAAAYTDVVKDWLASLAPQTVGCDLLTNMEIDPWYDIKDRSSFVYLYPTWTRDRDTCDDGG